MEWFMKELFFILWSFVFFVPSCFGNIIEDFKRDSFESLNTLKQINESIKQLDDKESKSYFGEVAAARRFKQARTLFEQAEKSINSYHNQILSLLDGVTTPKELSLRLFLPFCHQFYLIKGFHHLRDTSKEDSLCKKHTEDSLKAFSIYEKYWTDDESILFTYLNIEPAKKRPDGIQRYSLHVDEKAHFLFVKKTMRNITNRIEILNGFFQLNNLLLEKRYKQELLQQLRNIEEHFRRAKGTSLVSLVRDPNFGELRKTDLSTEALSIPEEIFDTLNFLRHSARVVFEPFSLSFYGLEGRQDHLNLTPAEKQNAISLFTDFMEKRQEASQPQKKEKKSVKKKKNTKKKKQLKKKNALKLARCNEEKEKNELPAEDESSFSLQDTVIEQQDTKDGAALASMQPSAEDSKPSNRSSSLLSEEPNDEKVEAINDALNILQTLQDATRGQSSNYFFIYHKAYSLSISLREKPELLEQVQNGISQLSLKLQELNMRNSNLKPKVYPVPKLLESEFNYIMETPLCYLKGIRFGSVRVFLEKLGATIDPSHEGSRIGIQLNGKKTSIHLHDSKNGELDGGRIMNLRKLLIDAAYVVKN